MRTEKRVQAVIVKKGKVLLLRRKDRFDGKFYWRLVKGGVESTESKLKALEREVKEETGISFEKAKEIYYYEVEGRVPQKVSAFLVETQAEPELSVTAKKEGILKAQWFSPRQALEKLFFGEEKSSLKKALGKI